MFKGIDVSAHQGRIDWEKVKNSGIQFAILRLGFGSDMQSQDDAYFEANVQGCESAGLPWGTYLYSYALNLEDAKSEVQHALRLLKNKKPEYPVFFDMEDADGYKKNHGMPSSQTLIDICKTFLLGLEEAGYYASLYANLSWFNNQLNSSELDRFDKWVAQWHASCTYKKPYGIWQYSDNGKVSGISGNVDMNISYKDYPSIIKANGLNGFKQDATQTPPAPTLPNETENSFTTYIVKSGDTLWGIAERYLGNGSKYSKLKSLNGLASDTIYPGQTLKIPTNGQSESYTTYTIIQKGDTLWSVARRFLGDGTRYKEIMNLNSLESTTIYPGQVLKIPN